MKKFEQIKFYLRMLLLNRRNSIIMFIGLGISLALIAESLMFIYSFQFGAFSGFYQETPTRQFTIGLGSMDLTEDREKIIDKLKATTEEVIEKVHLEDSIIRLDWFLTRGGLFAPVEDISGNRTYVDKIVLCGVPADYLSALQDMLYNGTLPQKTGDVIFIAEQGVLDSTNISLLSSIPIYTHILAMPPLTYEQIIAIGMPEVGTFVNVSGTIRSVDFTNPRGIYSDNVKAMSDYLGEVLLVTSYSSLVNIIDDIMYYPLYTRATPTGRVVFNLEAIDSFRIKQEISKINTLAQELTRTFEAEERDVHIYAFITDMLLDFNREFIIFQLFGVLFITPIIGMSLSLTSYSANLMKRRQKRQVSNMLQRGASRKEVLSLLIGQVVETTITAVLISIIMGYGFCLLMSKSLGFLDFTGIIRNPALNMIIFYVIVGGGFIFSIIINALNVWKMSQITTFEAYSEHEQKKAAWEKAYLDIVLLIIGIALWLIVRLKLKGITAYSFAYGLGTTAPICLILGGILLASRVYPKIVDFVSNLAWRIKNLEIIGLATKRSSRRRSDTIRSLILITLTFTLIFTSLITISSYQEFDRENSYYALGADILIENVETLNNKTKLDVLSVEGVASATYLKTTTQITTYASVTYSYIVLGIDPLEFAETAYFDSEYLGGRRPIEFFSQLINDNEVFMQKDQLKNIGGEKGRLLPIVYYKYPYGDLNRTVKVIDTYDFLPRYFVEYPVQYSSIYRFNIVGTYNNVAQFASGNYNINANLLARVEEGYDISDVALAIEEKINRGVENVVEQQSIFEGSMRNIMLYGSVNASFISSLLITVSAIALMILIQSIENEREVVTLKVLGISPKQLFGMFLTEASSVVLFGSIIGAGLGIFAASMFTDMLTFQTIIPVSEIMFPTLELVFAFILLFGSAVLAAALTSWIIFRKDTIKAIKTI